MMENILTLNSTCISNNNTDIANTERNRLSNKSSVFNPDIDNMVTEGGESFFRYLKNMSLSKESHLMVLSSNHHYFYDENELKDVRTLVNLKKLNLIKNPDLFLTNLINILPSKANLIGCFADGKTINGNGNIPLYKSTRILNRFINFLDYKTNYFMTRNEVCKLLEKHGFKIIDMSEINGLTFFCAQVFKKQVEIRA